MSSPSEKEVRNSGITLHRTPELEALAEHLSSSTPVWHVIKNTALRHPSFQNGGGTNNLHTVIGGVLAELYLQHSIYYAQKNRYRMRLPNLNGIIGGGYGIRITSRGTYETYILRTRQSEHEYDALAFIADSFVVFESSMIFVDAHKDTSRNSRSSQNRLIRPNVINDRLHPLQEVLGFDVRFGYVVMFDREKFGTRRNDLIPEFESRGGVAIPFPVSGMELLDHASEVVEALTGRSDLPIT